MDDLTRSKYIYLSNEINKILENINNIIIKTDNYKDSLQETLIIDNTVIELYNINEIINNLETTNNNLKYNLLKKIEQKINETI